MLVLSIYRKAEKKDKSFSLVAYVLRRVLVKMRSVGFLPFREHGFSWVEGETGGYQCPSKSYQLSPKCESPYIYTLAGPILQPISQNYEVIFRQALRLAEVHFLSID